MKFLFTYYRYLIFLGANVGFSSLLIAQDTLKTKDLAEVKITATRLTTNALQSALSVSVLDKFRLQTATQQLSIYENLGAVPGVFAMNPDNFAQDLRVSIRGFGARASFGIRGIRIFTDGLPEGTPDGQADVDNIDMGVLRQMEVIRGAASGLYGNAAGGVIYMLTEIPTQKKPLAEANVSVGSWGFRRYQAKVGQKIGAFSYFLNLSDNKSAGYRYNSDMKSQLLNLKIGYELSPKTQIWVLGNYGNSPIGNDPGGLTQAQNNENPRQAGANNTLFQTGETVQQGRLGLTAEHTFSEKHTVQFRAFRTNRSFTNRLAVVTNGYGALERTYGGVGFGYQLNTKLGKVGYRLKTGLDLEYQTDNRKRFAYLKQTQNNVTVYIPDRLVLEQTEGFESKGLYLIQEITPTQPLLISIGLRYDDLRASVSDGYLTDGDQSGSSAFQKLNPLAGLSYTLGKNHSVYANLSTTFETPTLNELSNNPTGQGGFNPTLQPQTAQSMEIGAKGTVKNRFRYELAFFKVVTENDLVPYQVAGQGTKTFFRNVGKTSRKGIELGLSYLLAKGFTAYYTHTFSNFKYQTYTLNDVSFAGNALPAIPKNQGQFELRYFAKKGFFGSIQGRIISQIFANDANTFVANGYQSLNLRLGHTVALKTIEIEPYLAVNNLNNARYMANVLINAQADRYFEPASPRYYFGGVKLRLR